MYLSEGPYQKQALPILDLSAVFKQPDAEPVVEEPVDVEPPVARPLQDHYLCSLHGKKRSVQNMVQTVTGEWQCAPHAICKGGVAGVKLHWPEVQPPVVQQPLVKLEPVRPVVQDHYLCSVHGRKRSLQNLVQSANGEWRCAPMSICKGAICVYWARFGSCKDGQRCKYAHASESFANSTSRLECARGPTCEFFARGVCRFMHSVGVGGTFEGVAPESLETAVLNQQATTQAVVPGSSAGVPWSPDGGGTLGVPWRPPSAQGGNFGIEGAGLNFSGNQGNLGMGYGGGYGGFNNTGWDQGQGYGGSQSWGQAAGTGQGQGVVSPQGGLQQPHGGHLQGQLGPRDTAECCMHGCTRTGQNLIQTENGQWRCREGFECKQPKGGRGGRRNKRQITSSFLNRNSRGDKKRKLGPDAFKGAKMTLYILVTSVQAEGLQDGKLELVKKNHDVEIDFQEQVQGAKDRTFTITGRRADLANGLIRVAELIAEKEEGKSLSVRILVDENNIGCLIGPGGIHIRRIRAISGGVVRVSVGLNNLGGSTMRRVRVFGSKNDRFDETMQQVILELSFGKAPNQIVYVPQAAWEEAPEARYVHPSRKPRPGLPFHQAAPILPKKPRRIMKGDWMCHCGANNFARRTACFLCGTNKPPGLPP